MVSIGGGGGSKSKGTKPKDLTPPAFAGLRPEIAEALQALIATGGAQFGQQPSVSGGAGTPAPLVAPITARETSTLGALAGGVAPSATATAGNDLLLKTIQGQFLDPASNPFLSAAIQAEQNRLAENFRLVEAPLLQSRFTQAGQSIQPQGSSAFDTAAAIALRGLSSAQGDVATRLLAENFGRERAAQQSAVTQQQQISSDETQRLVQTLQAQALPRLIQQQGIDNGLAEFRRRMEMILAALGLSGQLASPTVASSGGGSTTKPQFSFGVGFS